MKTLLRFILLLALASAANGQQVFRADVYIGQSWGTVRVHRWARLQINGPVINTYRYRIAGIQPNWISIQGMESMTPTNILQLTSGKNVPAGFNQSMSGQVMTIAPSNYLMEFDFNSDGSSDGSAPFSSPHCEMTLYYPGGTGSYFDFWAQPVTITLNTGGEPTASVHDPLPILGDTDGDGIADQYDPDDDNDGIPDELDMFPKDPAEKDDNDNDGTGDNADTDDDNDGTNDNEDPFPKNPGEFIDKDKDGWGANTDPDDNDPAKPGGIGGDNGNGDTPGGGTGPPAPGGGGGGDQQGDDPRLNETSEGWAPVPTVDDGGKGQTTANKANSAGGKMGQKLFGFLPASQSPIPMATALPINISLANGVSINKTIQLDAAPFPQIRTVFLVCFIALCGVAFLKKVTI